MRIVKLCSIIFLTYYNAISQSTVPVLIKDCITDTTSCVCLNKELSASSDDSLLAYAHYYIANDYCDITLQEKKYHFSQARKYWDRINYNSFRYGFTYMYFLQHYEGLNIDSVEYYYAKQFELQAHSDEDVQFNLIESLRILTLQLFHAGDYNKAIYLFDAFEESLWFNHLTNTNFATYLGYKADAFIETPLNALIDKGKSYNLEALQLLEDINIPNHKARRYYNLYSLGRYYEKKQQHDTAFTKFLESYDYLMTNNSQQISTSHGLSPHFNEANNLDAIAEMALKLEKYDECIRFSRISVQAYRADSTFETSEARPYINLAEAYVRTQEFEKADEILNKAILSSIGDTTKQIDLQDKIEINSANAPDLLIKAMSIKILNYIQSAKSIRATESEEATKYYDITISLFDSYIKSIKNKTSKFWNRSLQNNIFTLGIENALLTDDPKSVFDFIENNRQIIEAKNPLVSKPIHENNQIIQYSFTSDSLIGITSIANEYDLQYLASKTSVERLIKSLIEKLKLPKSDIRKEQKALYKILIDPLNLNQDIAIQIIADGMLHELPFELLLDSNNHYLIESYTINYQLSHAFYQNLLKKSDHNDSIAIIAPTYNPNPNPSITLSRDGNYDDELYNLMHTEKEVNAMKENIEKSEIIPNDKLIILEKLQSDKIVHFAGHAISNSIDPEKAYLALSSAIDIPSNRINLSNLRDIQIQNEMIVLSACETGVGQVIEGEGSLSIARGFLYAGAKSVISTLWSVNDESTSMIISEFYKELLMGKRKDEALRQAKLNYLDQVDPEYQHPYYWAGFIAMGDMSPLFFPHRKWYYAGSIILGLCLLGMVYWKKIIPNRRAA